MDDNSFNSEIIFVYNAPTIMSNLNSGPTSVISTVSEPMKDAYKIFRSQKFETKFFLAKKIIDKKLFNNNTGQEHRLFVLDSFSDSIYEYLKRGGARIVSPYVVKYTLKKTAIFQNIPKRPFPIYSQCMRGLVITSTNFSGDVKRNIEDKVAQMCGTYVSSLNGNVKYLISNSVLTQKYRVAAMIKIPVMKVEWVEECWNNYQYEIMPATSSKIISKFSLPIFHDLTITVSQVI